MVAHYLAYIPTFAKVVERQSFSSAARDLGMTKSAVSKHIAALEDSLRVRLLNRTTRKLSLTEEGQIFLDKCTHIIEELAHAEQQLQNLNESPSGVLKINAPVSFGAFHLAPVLAEFACQYPDVRLEIDFNDRFIDIVESGVDVCIRIASLTDSSLIARKLAPCQMAIVASPEYIKAHGMPQHPDELINHRFIEYSNVERLRELRYRDPADGAERVTATCVVMRCNNGEMLRQAAISGIGLVAMPTFIIGDDLRSGKLVSVLSDYQVSPERNIYALFPHNRFLSAKVRLFIDFIAGRYAGKPGWEV
jgi:DNA-binding transcriptional LysR family regulator